MPTTLTPHQKTYNQATALTNPRIPRHQTTTLTKPRTPRTCPPPENRLPDNTKDTKDTKDTEPKRPDKPPSVNLGVLELCDRDIFYEAFSVEDEDGKRELDLDRMVLDVMDSEGFEEWHNFIQDWFEDSEKKATPEDWASLFSQSISTDAVPSDSFDSECGPLSTVQKSGLTQMAFLMACVAPSQFANKKHCYDKATDGGGCVLMETPATVIWMGAVQTLGSPWIGIRSLQQNWHNFVHRRKVRDNQIQGLLTAGNKAKLVRVDRILSTLDQTAECLCCLRVC